MTNARDRTEQEPLAISREQAARRLGLGLRTLDRLLASGELKARKFQRRVLVPIAEIERDLTALAEHVAEEILAWAHRNQGLGPIARLNLGVPILHESRRRESHIFTAKSSAVSAMRMLCSATE